MGLVLSAMHTRCLRTSILEFGGTVRMELYGAGWGPLQPTGYVFGDSVEHSIGRLEVEQTGMGQQICEGGPSPVKHVLVCRLVYGICG